MGDLLQRVADLERRMRGIPSRFPGAAAAAALPPWLAALVKGGNTLITTPSEVYGIKRYAGEVVATDWKHVNRRATATGTLTGGALTAITLTDCGLGYAPSPAAAPVVTVSPPPGGGTQAVVTATVAADGDRVEGVYVTDCGTDYTYASVTFDAAPGGGVTALGVCVVRDGKVVAVNVTQKGRGYTSDPAATITGDGTGATATAVRGVNAVTLAITNAGAGYTALSLTIAAPPVGVTPAPPSLADDTPADWDDGLGWGIISAGNLSGTLVAGAATLLVHDDRGMVLGGLMGDGGPSVPYSRAPDSILSWYQTLVKVADADPDADGVLPAWVPMAGGQ